MRKLPRSNNLGVILTSDIFLPIRHTHHPYLGCSLVALQLKILLVYVVTNYGIEPLATRPKTNVSVRLVYQLKKRQSKYAGGRGL